MGAMGILASALPGFRDLRAPLTAGYIWVVFAYLLFAPDLQERPADPVGAALYDLAETIGPIWTAVAFGTVAYLLGAITEGIIEFAVRPFDRRVAVRTYLHRRRLPSDDLDHVESQLAFGSGSIAEEFERGDTLIRQRMARRSDLEESTAMKEELRALERFAAEQDRAASREPDLPATLLVAEKPTLYAEVDRLRAESDLRLAVFPPLAGLSVLLTAQSEKWAWLLILLGALLLVVQGLMRRRQSRQTIVDAMQMKVIQSPSVDRMRDYVNELNQRLQVPRRVEI